MPRFVVEVTESFEADLDAAVSWRLANVEPFAGGGGLSLGTSLAGFRHLAAVECGHSCRDTLRPNQAKGYPLIGEDTRIIEGDVRDVDWSSGSAGGVGSAHRRFRAEDPTSRFALLLPVAHLLSYEPITLRSQILGASAVLETKYPEAT